MTEAEWLAGADPTRMLDHVWNHRTGGRKALLFLCSAAHTLDAHLTELRSWAVLEIAERMADGRAAVDEVARADWMARDIRQLAADRHSARLGALTGHHPRSPGLLAALLVHTAAGWDVSVSRPILPGYVASMINELEAGTTAAFVRDIFGNPFRPVVADPGWLTPTAVALAEAIYEERAFNRLPVLADALEEAGCTDADVLDHCRGDGPHVRGCWVVDLVLGKG